MFFMKGTQRYENYKWSTQMSKETLQYIVSGKGSGERGEIEAKQLQM